MAVPRLLHRSLVDGILLALVLAGAGLAAEPEIAERPAEPAATVEAAEKDRKKPLRIPEATDKPIITEHSITLGEMTLEYRAETGMLPLLSEEGTPRAGVFYVAYTAKPAGDPAERGEERSPIGGLSRVDLTLAMSEPYVPMPEPDTVDVVRCFLLDWPETRRRYVTGMLPEPGNRAIVHHLLLSIGDASRLTDLRQLDAADAEPGFDCSGGLPNLTPVGGSLYGGDYPRGLGTPVDPGAAMVLQVHYAVTDRLTGPDLTRVHVRLEDEAEEVRSSIVQNPMWLAGPGMSIPAGDPDAAFWFDYRPTLFTGGKPVQLQSVVPHAHRYARRIRMLALHADGTETCLLEIPDWEFGWEQPYWFEDPIAFAPEDRLYIECRFDNSAANQPDGAAPRDIGWGDNDQDMCAGFVSFTVEAP